MALGIFALICLCCGDTLPLLPSHESVRTWTSFVIAALLTVFAVLLGLNTQADQLMDQLSHSSDPLGDLQSAAAMDRFEWTDHMLSYVISYQYGMDALAGENMVQQRAEQYAQRLARVDSNSIPIHLAEYYFVTGQPAQAFAMLEKYVSYVSSNSDTWKTAFQLLEAYTQDTPEFREDTARIYQMLTDWNEQHMGTISLDEQTMTFIQGVLPQ